jgi:recombination protein RecT
MRTGAYININATDVREGEIVEGSRDRMRGTMEFSWIEDDAEREKKPIIGYVAYYKLVNGMEKMVYMSKAQVDAHEQRNRKGQNMTKGWRDNYDEMALKTVLRRLLSKWGMLSIDYRSAPKFNASASESLANAIAAEDAEDFIPAEGAVSESADPETGEILPGMAEVV